MADPMTLTHLTLTLAAACILALGGSPLVALVSVAVIISLVRDEA